jgi:phosphohistidine phosphatase
MLLVLFRHGIAVDREAPACPPDPDRPLTKKGWRRTRAAAEGLRLLGVRPDSILSSPYLRARESARLCAEALGFDVDAIKTTRSLLPDAEPQLFLERLGRERLGACVIAVGHAPNLDRVLRHALDGGRLALTALKKAGAACVQLDRAAPGGELQWLMEPAALRALAHVDEPE